MLPTDWRRRVTAMVRGAEPPAAELFAGGVVLSPLDQIEVYREQYRLRLGDALREEVPGLVALLGEEAVDELLFAYLDAHPSRSFTLNRIADALPDFLVNRGAPSVQVDMARLDRAVMDGFEAADGVDLTVEALASAPRLVLQPHVRLLSLSHDVHGLRSAVVQGRERPPVTARPVHLLVFRRALKMRHLEVDADCLAVLQALAVPTTLEQALADAVEAGARPDMLAAHVGEWFSLFSSRGIVQACSV